MRIAHCLSHYPPHVVVPGIVSDLPQVVARNPRAPEPRLRFALLVLIQPVRVVVVHRLHVVVDPRVNLAVYPATKLGDGIVQIVRPLDPYAAELLA